MTRSGAARPIRWIGTRRYTAAFAAGRPDILPVRIAQGALEDNVPRRDLFVSPLHAMFLDGVLIPASALVNGHSITQPEPADQVEYFHLELDSHDIILAEGAASETFVDDGSRGMFLNAAEYHALCPDAVPAPPRYCAPRVEGGETLGTVRRRLIARARPPRAVEATAAPMPTGPLRGHLDVARRDMVAGWAWDAQRPHEPVALEILDNGEVVARLQASDYRLDLENAGVGDGRHGFLWRVPGGLAPHKRHVIAVRRAGDGAELGQSPRVVEAATGFDAAMEQNLAGIIDGLPDGAEQERVLSIMLAQSERLLQRRADADGQREARLAWREYNRRLGRSPDTAADASADAPTDPGLRALVVDERLPDPARNGGSQAILSHMQALRELGYQVSFIAAHELSPDAAVVAALEAEQVLCWRTPHYASVEEVLRRQANCFDLIYLHRAAMAAAYLALARQHCPRARILCSVADLDHLRLAQSRPLRQAECAAAWPANKALTHSTQEAARRVSAAGDFSVGRPDWRQPGYAPRLPAAPCLPRRLRSRR